jgi:hypothetical protein
VRHVEVDPTHADRRRPKIDGSDHGRHVDSTDRRRGGGFGGQRPLGRSPPSGDRSGFAGRSPA